jgi:hypothetical protein
MEDQPQERKKNDENTGEWCDAPLPLCCLSPSPFILSPFLFLHDMQVQQTTTTSTAATRKQKDRLTK